MNCKDIEPLIYLIDELTASEKEKVGLHSQHCGSCKKLMEDVRLQQKVVRKLASAKPQLVDPGRLRHKIMSALEPKRKPSWRQQMAAYAEALWMRSTLGAVSVCLIVFFVIEQQSDPVVPFSKPAGQPGVRLNISKLLEANRERRKAKAPGFPSLYACLKMNNCDHPKFKNFKQRKNNERI